MTTYQGIGAVTQAIRYLVDTSVRAVVPEASTTLESPERQARAARDEPRISVFLLQVLPDPALRNNDLPMRAGTGQLLNTPKVALNLRYLLTFFGPAVTAQLMLGAAQVALRENAYLDPGMVRDSVLDHPELQQSGLADQQPAVTLSPFTPGLEELSRTWSGFFQVPYTLATMYEASGLVLEASWAAPPAIPVRDVVVTVR